MSNDRHILSLSGLQEELDTDISEGLSIREARIRLQNEKKRAGGEVYSLFVSKKSNYFGLALSFLLSPGTIILVLISLLVAIFGNLWTGLTVLIITVVGAAVSGVVLQSSRRKLESMNDFASPMVKVRRGGSNFYTDGRNLVLGDLIVLAEGDLLPCDARIISSRDLTVKELINTKDGIRNRVVSKNHLIEYMDDSVSDPDAENVLYAGSAILSGEALALVVATGEDVYLAKYLHGGDLAENGSPDANLKKLKPLLYRTSFIAIASLAILSLLSLLTLRETSFVSNFLMLLSSVAMISLELIRMGQENISSAIVERMSRSGAAKKKQDVCAHVRGESTIETLSGVSLIALLGRAALYDGISKISGVLVSAKGEVLSSVDPETSIGHRILTCAHTYIKAVRESGTDIDLVRDGIADSLEEYIKGAGFDMNAASLVLKSLYFADDASGKSGYACAETSDSEYRVILTFDENILSFCERVRSMDGNNVDRLKIEGACSSFIKNVRQNGGRCLFVVSETNGEPVLEGILSLFESPARELESAIGEINKMSSRTVVMLVDEEKYILENPSFSSLFDGKIARASEFRAKGLKITDGGFDYCAYLGFTPEEYASLIVALRQNGEVVAAYGVDNSYHNVMSRADIAISCDTLRYSSSKYMESAYERLASGGRDSNVRCSQMTRLLSKVIVHRTHAHGGGLLSIANAIRRSRAARLSFVYSILFFAMVMTSLISTSVMSVLLGIQLINSVEAACLAFVGAILSMTVFAGAQPKYDIVYSKTSFAVSPVKILGDKLASILARAGAVCILSIVLKVLDVVGVFGETPSYTMPVFISLLLAVAVDLFVINLDFTRRGEGRRVSLSRFLIAYALVLFVGAVITQDALAKELFPCGIGTFEFIIVPAFCILYIAAVFAARLIEKNRKKG